MRYDHAVILSVNALYQEANGYWKSIAFLIYGALFLLLSMILQCYFMVVFHHLLGAPNSMR